VPLCGLAVRCRGWIEEDCRTRKLLEGDMQMRHIKPGNLFFRERQLLELNETKANLRTLNRAALDQLRHIELSGFGRRDGKLDKSLLTIATLMNSILQTREQIIADGGVQQPELIQVIFSDFCPNCGKGPHPLTEADEEADLPEALKQDQAWQSEIDRLLMLVHRTEKHVLRRCMSRWGSRGTLANALPVAVSRLRRALLRQERHLQEIAPKQAPKIEVLREDYEICPQCHAPFDTDSDSERDPAECSHGETNALCRALHEDRKGASDEQQ